MKQQSKSQPYKTVTGHRLTELRRVGIAVVAVLLLALTTYTFSAAQENGLITRDLTGTLTAEDLANRLDASEGGVAISNVVYTGNPAAAGTFVGGQDIVGFDSGIILSTGKISDVAGPNTSTIKQTDHPEAGDDDLTTLSGQATEDAAILSFDFVPNGDKVYFNFVFASEEYNQYVNSKNDVFAFYVNGENCALIPESGKAVSINTINRGNTGTDMGETASHPELFRNNAAPVDGAYPINTSMNGLTTVLTCEAAVNSGQTNTLKLAIADAGDGIYDSNVFIEAGSLSTTPPTPTPTAEATATALPTPTATAEPTADAKTTNSRGDVHIFTPDGLIFDFQGTGDFVAVQTTDSSKVVVQARQENPPGNNRVSMNSAVAMQVGSDVVEFYSKPDPTFYLNGEARAVPTSDVALEGGGSIVVTVSEGRRDMTIYWPDGSFAARVIMFGNSHIDYGVARTGGDQTYEGLIGNLDGNAQNDMQIRDGGQLKPPPSLADLNRFGDSWRVTAEESLFSVALEGEEEAAESAEQPLTMQAIPEADREAAAEACRAAGITDPIALRECTYDVGATGDDIFIESAKIFEESTEDVPAAAKVPAQPGEALGGNIFDADQAERNSISILDGDDLIITTGTLADGTDYIRFNIYRNGTYIASYSVAANSEVASAISAAISAVAEEELEADTADEAEVSFTEEEIVALVEAIPVCAEGLLLLAENMYEYPAPVDDWNEAYSLFSDEFLPGCEGVSSFIEAYPDDIDEFFEEVGFSFEEFGMEDWTSTLGMITGNGSRIGQYCPDAHQTQYDCVSGPERSLIAIDAAFLALELLYGE